MCSPSGCTSIILIEALFSRSANFINCCLKSDNPRLCFAIHGDYCSQCSFQGERLHLTAVFALTQVQRIYR